ncbi:iron export ABC transporter permease subunit FetB [bacterium]|nr:iron export ABC transporter permease subunit FetB [bacterium]
MMNEYLQLTYIDILLASGFILVAGIVSLVLRLKFEKTLFVAALRTALQLLLAGAAIGFVFDIQTSWLVLLLAVLMVLLSGREAVRRQKYKLTGAGWDTLISMFVSSFLVAILVTAVVIGSDPWWNPPLFIPMIGMIIGNSLNGISLALERFLSSCKTQRREIEMRLYLGATVNEATLPLFRDAIRAGMTPMINAMTIVGIVSIPGMMTGQLLAGADPRDAVMYQIVVMYMLAASTTLGSLMVVYLVKRRLTTDHGTIRVDF